MHQQEMIHAMQTRNLAIVVMIYAFARAEKRNKENVGTHYWCQENIKSNREDLKHKQETPTMISWI